MPTKYAGQRTRVLVADNHEEFAAKCKRMLEPEFYVVRLVTEGRKVGQSVIEAKPDVVIIDMIMPPSSGFDLGELVKTACPNTKIIYMTVAARFEEAAEALRRGGAAYISKFDFPEALRVAVRRAIRGDLYFSPHVIGKEQR